MPDRPRHAAAKHSVSQLLEKPRRTGSRAPQGSQGQNGRGSTRCQHRSGTLCVLLRACKGYGIGAVSARGDDAPGRGRTRPACTRRRGPWQLAKVKVILRRHMNSHQLSALIPIVGWTVAARPRPVEKSYCESLETNAPCCVYLCSRFRAVDHLAGRLELSPVGRKSVVQLASQYEIVNWRGGRRCGGVLSAPWSLESCLVVAIP